MLKLGRDESVCWLKVITDGIWSEEAVPSDWRDQYQVTGGNSYLSLSKRRKI